MRKRMAALGLAGVLLVPAAGAAAQTSTQPAAQQETHDDDGGGKWGLLGLLGLGGHAGLLRRDDRGRNIGSRSIRDREPPPPTTR